MIKQLRQKNLIIYFLNSSNYSIVMMTRIVTKTRKSAQITLDFDRLLAQCTLITIHNSELNRTLTLRIGNCNCKRAASKFKIRGSLLRASN